MIVRTLAQLAEIVEIYSAVDAFAFDVETHGEHRGDPRRNDITWLSLATYGRGDVIPMGHPNGRLLRTDYPVNPSGKVSVDARKATKVWSPPPAQLFPGEVFAALKPVFAGPATKVGQNTKFDMCSVAKYLGALPAGPVSDTMVLSYLLNSSHKPVKGYGTPYSLGAIAHRELEFGYDKTLGKDVDAHSFDDVAKYSFLDARITWLLHRRMSRRLVKAGLGELYDLEMRVLEVLCAMEIEGAPIDEAELVRLDTELGKDVRDCVGKVYRAAGRAFNLNSPKQKIEVLFGPVSEGGQGLKAPKVTKTGNPSVDFESLTKFAGKNPVVDALLEYTEVAKLHGTYVRGYLHGPIKAGKQQPPFAYRVHPEDHLRIYADFVQTGAETGRFSCREPNLQNIPRPDTARGKAIRGLFIAPEGHRLVVADFSQIEPRVLASMSGDPALVASYTEEGGDFYSAIAAPFGLSRNAGKKIFLSVAYGIGPDKLAADTGISLTKAKHVLRDFSTQFPVAARFKAQVIAECRRRDPSHVRTLMGRRRFLPEIHSKNFGVQMRAERQAFNTIIQGSAADLNKLAMVRLHAALPADMRLLLTVHDEFVTLVPAATANEGAEIVRQAMEGIDMLKVPLVADVKVVQRWSEAKA